MVLQFQEQLIASIIIRVAIKIERRSQTGVIANDLGVVRRIQSVLRGVRVVADVRLPNGNGSDRTARERKSVVHHNRASHVDPDDAIVELVADQCVAILQPDRTSGQRCRNA